VLFVQVITVKQLSYQVFVPSLS